MSRCGTERQLYPVLALLVLASASCLAALAAHAALVDASDFGWLLWNLWLAWVPLLLALLVSVGAARRWPLVLLVGIGIAWLAFFPNAPYIVTDFVHVGDSASSLADISLITIFSAAGLALGLVSLVLVQRVIARVAGASASWGFSLAVIALSGVGVYLGRIHRLNSWDAFTDPGRPVLLVVERLAAPLAYPGFYVGLAAYTVALAAAYVLVTRLPRFAVGGEDSRPPGGGAA